MKWIPLNFSWNLLSCVNGLLQFVNLWLRHLHFVVLLSWTDAVCRLRLWSVRHCSFVIIDCCKICCFMILECCRFCCLTIMDCCTFCCLIIINFCRFCCAKIVDYGNMLPFDSGLSRLLSCDCELFQFVVVLLLTFADFFYLMIFYYCSMYSCDGGLYRLSCGCGLLQYVVLWLWMDCCRFI